MDQGKSDRCLATGLTALVLVLSRSLIGLLIAARKASDFARKQVILLVGMTVSVLFWGLINETRVYSMFIPFAALLPFRSSPQLL